MADTSSAKGISDRIARVVVSRDRIDERVKELAAEIAECYGDTELTILAVLTGSLIFLADLIRRLPLMMRMDLVSISSYPGASTQSQGAKLAAELPGGLAGKHVLIVDDILDSGGTLQVLSDAVAALHPASLRSCVFLRKRRPDLPGRPEPDFVGIEVGPGFLVGYGLDFDNLYRNLPDVCVLRQHAGRTGPNVPVPGSQS